MNRIVNIFFITFILLGFTATLVNQYQLIKVTIVLLEENHENSGESETLLSDSSNGAKILTTTNTLNILGIDLNSKSEFSSNSTISDLITGSDHFSPPEVKA